MVRKGESIEESEHVLRYIDKKFVDGATGVAVVDGAGFLARRGEGAPSVNWLECFPPPLENQIAQIRTVKRIRYERRGRLAKLHVGSTIQHLATHARDLVQLSFVHDPLDPKDSHPADPSHALMAGIPEIGSSDGDFIRDLLRECIQELLEPQPG